MLQVDDLVAGYGRTQVLHEVCLEVPERGVVALLGHRGAGKSTLLRAIAGTIRTPRGRVEFHGEDITGLNAHARARRGIGHVPPLQQGAGNATPREVLSGVADGVRGAAARLDDVLDLFPALACDLDRPARALPGHQRHQLALARALLLRPRLLLVDQPGDPGGATSASGSEEAATRAVIRTLADRGLPVLAVEGSVGFALEACDAFLVLANGRVIERGRRGDGGPDGVRTEMAI